MRQANPHVVGESIWADEDRADEDDAPLRAAVQLAEREKSWTAYDRAKGFAGSGRSLVIVQWYARQDPL